MAVQSVASLEYVKRAFDVQQILQICIFIIFIQHLVAASCLQLPHTHNDIQHNSTPLHCVAEISSWGWVRGCVVR